KTGKKITIPGSDVAGFDRSKVECFNCHKMGYFARECRSPRSQDIGKRESYKNNPKVEEHAPEAMIAIDELKDNKTEYLRNELKEVKKEKESTDFKIENFENASKDLDRLLESQKLDKDMKGVGFNEYCVVPPPPAQVYSPLKKDLSWMGLPEFVDDTVTDYTRPTPSIDVSKSVSKEQEERWKSNNPSFFEQGGSSGNVVSKPMIKFVKESGVLMPLNGVDIGKGVEYCVNEWGIDAIMAVSVDNASANDSAIDFLRKTFAKKDNCLLNGKLDSHHMRGSYFESCSARWY
nr:hypothetical protein [Tanacetum cinerariifolium]